MIIRLVTFEHLSHGTQIEDIQEFKVEYTKDGKFKSECQHHFNEVLNRMDKGLTKCHIEIHKHERK